VKVAVFADVHGNAAALHAALADIDARGDIEHLYCLGDMMAIGPDTNEVLEALFSRRDVSLLLGNHDDAVLALVAGREPASRGEERAHHEWVAAHVDRSLAAHLAGLPHEMNPSLGGARLLFRHYHSDPVKGLATIEAEPTAASLDARYDGSPAAVVAFGHDHRRHLIRSGLRLYIDPGALGCCERSVARASLTGSGSVSWGLGMRILRAGLRAMYSSTSHQVRNEETARSRRTRVP